MSDKLFKTASFEDELYRSMENQLKQADNAGLKRLAQAAEFLDAAAEIFDNAGMSQEAQEVRSVSGDNK